MLVLFAVVFSSSSSLSDEYLFRDLSRGLEELLSDELCALGGASCSRRARRVFSGDWSTCYRANLESRIATRILWHIVRVRTPGKKHLPAGGAPVVAESFCGVADDARGDDSDPMPAQVAGFRHPARQDDDLRPLPRGCGDARISDAQPGCQRACLSFRKRCLYLDTSGQPLWQRGLRKASVDAPLKENLAAGILGLIGWQPGTPLVDPMCGSGTFCSSRADRPRPGARPRSRLRLRTARQLRAVNWANIRQAAEARCKAPSRSPSAS